MTRQNLVHAKLLKAQSDQPVFEDKRKVQDLSVKDLSVKGLAEKSILHYRVIEQIGQGGMGVVYKAEDTKLKREVAVKFLPHFLTASEESKARFKLEAQAAAALNHPNIATIYAIEEANDQFFIAMEFIEGRDLKELLMDDCPLTIDNSVDYAIQIAEGLNAAHKKGIIHRDIKAANIMVTEEGHIKIMDFGLAKIRGTQLTEVGTMMGTANYMSPEQAQGLEITPATDLWSLGVLLYEMFSGQLPFRGDYPQAVIYAIMHEPAQSLQELRSEVSAEMQSIVNRLLEKDRDERYKDASELLVDLISLQSGYGESGQASKPGRSTQLSKKLWMIAASLFATIFIVLAFFLFTGKAAKDSTSPASLAIMPFQFEGDGNWQWLAGAFTELVNSNLVQSSSLQVLDVMQRKRIMSNLNIQSERVDLEEAIKIARAVNIRNIVLGSLSKIGEKILIQGNVFEAKEGALLSSLMPLESHESAIYDAATNISTQIATTLSAHRPTSNEGDNHTWNTTHSLDVLQHYTEGRDAYFDGRYIESIEKLQKAIGVDSTFIDAYNTLAWSYWSVGETSKATNILARGKPYVAGLSEIEKLDYLCNVAGVEKRWKDYATYLQKLLKFKPFNPLYHYQYGWVQNFRFKQLDTGIAFMEKALQLDSTYTEVYNNLSYAYLRNGNKEKALQTIDLFSRLDPTDINPLDSKAEMLLLTGEYTKSLDLCERILAIQPDFVPTKITLARIFIAQAKYDDAHTILDKLLELTDIEFYESAAHTVKSEIYLKQRKFEKAQWSAEKAVTFDSTNFEAYWMQAKVLLELDNSKMLNLKLAAFDRALNMEGGLHGRWFLYHIKSELSLRKKDYEPAVVSLKKAIALGPKDQTFFLTALAKAYEVWGQNSHAAEQYESALAFNPNNPDAAFGLARAYETLGEKIKARQQYRMVIKLWANSDEKIEEVKIAKQKLATL